MNVTINFPAAAVPPPPPARRYTGWRGLHVVEGGRVPDPLGSPGVIPPYTPTVKLDMTAGIQHMSYDLMAHFNAAVRADRARWRQVHGWNVAMNNGTGFDEPGEPRRDYVTEYPAVRDAGAPLPSYDKMQRTFAGSFISGKQEGALIWCTPGVDAIDARGFQYVPGTAEAAATLATIIERGWYSFAVGEEANGPYRMKGHWHPTDFVVFPFVLDRPVAYLASFFAPWDADALPDPLKVGG